MTFATRLTKVRDRSEHCDERTGMCYHQAPPSERVVMHVRDAEQAKPHLEHNPLSLLGACYATPKRKLNDPETLPHLIDSFLQQLYTLLSAKFERLDDLESRFQADLDNICETFNVQWSRQKSGGDSAVSSEFVIAGMIFHHSRVKSELLHKSIEQSLIELTLFPT